MRGTVLTPAMSDRRSIRLPGASTRGRERMLLLATVVCLGIMLPVQADYEAGVNAYYRQDYETALREFKTVAATGDKNAQYNVGLMYLKGQGVPENPEEASRWFRRAAVQGQVDAQSFLGALHADGQGVHQDYSLAAYWLTRAADAGHLAAQSFLGQLYFDGLGVAQDYVQAYVWFSLAEARGYPESQAWREKAETLMSTAQREKAARRVEERLPHWTRRTQGLKEP
ncbi:MAG: tetratricopeptide repeat protein [Gammaproteobacteria bacterium]